jgi:anti-sigma regulatory factor (Ser/Thr protein kinase)
LMNKSGERKLSLIVNKNEEKNAIEIIIDDNGIGREKASETHRNSFKHQSMGMNINKERIRLLELTNDLKIDIKIIDKKSNEGISEGTKVQILMDLDEDETRIAVSNFASKSLAFLRKWLFLKLFLIIPVFSYSQVELTKNLKKDTLINCQNKSQIFIDKQSKIDIKSIDNQSFIALNSIKINPKLSKDYQSTFWLKIPLKNIENDTITPLLTVGNHQLVELYFKSNQVYQFYQKSNAADLPRNRSFRADNQYIPLKILPNQTLDLLIKIKDIPKLDFSISPKIISKNHANQYILKAFYDEYWIIIFNGFIISVLIFVTLFVFGLKIVNPQKFFLFYALYTFSIALFFIWEYEQSPYFSIIFSYLPFLKFTGNSNFYILLTHIFYFFFITEFLRIKKSMPIADKILRYCAYLLTAVVLVDIFIVFVLKRLDWSFEMYYFFQEVFPFLNIVLIVIVYLQKGVLAKFAKFGSTFLLIGGMAGFFTTTFGIEDYQLYLFRVPPSIIFSSGVFCEVICFSAAIGYRTYQIQREQFELNRTIQESELRTLRSQINPHFVFNSLNSIKSYILTHRSVEASEYLTDFSTLMRSILQHSKEQYITLTDELETAKLYVKLEQLRFEDGFRFDFNCEEGIDTDEILIPPMLLQPYLENAIKHGLMNKSGERILCLNVSKLDSETSIQIIIEDNGIGRQAASLMRKNIPKYQSMGMNINSERVELLNQMDESNLQIEIIDKKDPSGTIVRIKVQAH